MKNQFILISLFFFFFNNAFCESNIVYLDVNAVLNQSLVGKSIEKQINNIKIEKNKNFDSKKNYIKNKEKNILSKKNILSDDEFNKLINELNLEVLDYNNEIKDFEDKLKKSKLKNSQEILNILNPILTKYVEDNKISLLLNKNTIIIGKKNLDLTNIIVELLNKNISEMKLKYE